MNKADFTDLLKNPEKLGTEHIETLRKIVADFPFFSTAHVLLAKALANTNHYEYEKQLKITALLTGDRAVLYQFITGNKDQEGDIEAFNVPIELKVEKVSKPDFEITEEEAQEAALLNQANSLLEEAETTFNNEIAAEEEKETEQETSNVEAEVTNFDTEEVVDIDHSNQPESRGGKDLDTDETGANETTEEEVVNESESVYQDEESIAEENTTLSDEVLNDTKKEEDIAVENTEEVTPEFVEELEQEEENKQPVEIADEVHEETHHQIIEPVESVPDTISGENDDSDVSSEKEQSSDSLAPVELDNNTKEKVFQLAETEGTLVRFKGNFSEEILQDFDETSFEDNKENIETVTQSVTPILPKGEPAFSVPSEDNDQNDLSETTHEEQEDGVIAEEKSIEEETNIQKTTTDIDSNVEETIEEEKPELVFAVEPIEPVSLDALLEKYNDESDEESTFINDESITENKSDEDEENETLAEEELTESRETPNTEFSTVNVEGLNFIEWLNKNKAESNQNTESKVEAKAKTSVEDDEFTLYIQHLIKAKAESTLAKNIEAETQFEKTNLQEEKEEQLPITENIISIIELPDVDPRLIEEEEEVNDITPVIEPFMVEPDAITAPTINEADNDEDSTFEEIEAFQVQVNTVEEDTKEEKEQVVDTVVIPFIDEIYSGNVESILPDFEHLNAQSEEEEQHESFFTFDESKDLVVAENEITIHTDESDSNEAVSFETEALDENLFDSSFMGIFPSGNHSSDLSNQQKGPEVKTPQPKMEVESILEKFMRENPSITRPKAEFFNPVNVAKLSIEEKDEIVSETLASIYLKQGLVKKAISTYEKLSLIYPHKIAYFAALIKQLKTEHNIN